MIFISPSNVIVIEPLRIAIYGFVHLPPNSKSFEHHRHDLVINEEDALYIPLMAICGLRFCTAILLMVSGSIVLSLSRSNSMEFLVIFSGAVFNVW